MSEKWTVKDIPSQAGRRAIVTGANSGIGWHTALELARAGAEVILTVRGDEKGRDAVARIQREVPSAKVRYELLDLASLSSVRAFAERIVGQQLDLLVNNAGVMVIPERRLSEDGFEMQMASNFFGHFALTGLLLPALELSPSPRVTVVSSGAANMGLKRIRFEDMQWHSGYRPWNAYCQSKLADLVMMVELARRARAAGTPLISNGAHPGFALTNLQTTGRGKTSLNVVERLAAAILSQDAAGGALPTLRAATSPGARSGTYFGPSFIQLKGDPIPAKVPKPAQDEAAAKKLWSVAEELTGVRWFSGM